MTGAGSLHHCHTHCTYTIWANAHADLVIYFEYVSVWHYTYTKIKLSKNNRHATYRQTISQSLAAASDRVFYIITTTVGILSIRCHRVEQMCNRPCRGTAGSCMAYSQVSASFSRAHLLSLPRTLPHPYFLFAWHLLPCKYLSPPPVDYLTISFFLPLYLLLSFLPSRICSLRLPSFVTAEARQTKMQLQELRLVEKKIVVVCSAVLFIIQLSFILHINENRSSKLQSWAVLNIKPLSY